MSVKTMLSLCYVALYCYMFNLCCSRTNRFGVKGILLSLNVLLMSTVLTSDNSSKYIPRFKFLLSKYICEAGGRRHDHCESKN